MCTPGWSTYSTANKSLAGLPSGKLWSLPRLLLPTGHPFLLLSLGPLALTGGLPGRPLCNVASTPPLCKGWCSSPVSLLAWYPRIFHGRAQLCAARRDTFLPASGSLQAPHPAWGLHVPLLSPGDGGARLPGSSSLSTLAQVPLNHDHQKRVTAQVGMPNTP